MASARMPAIGDSPTDATNSTAHTSSCTDRIPASKTREPTINGRRHGDASGRTVPEAITPRGSPIATAKVIPATA